MNPDPQTTNEPMIYPGSEPPARIRPHPTEKVLRSQRDLVAFFIATGGWDDGKKCFDDIQADDYAKADAVLNHLIDVLNKVKL